MISESLRRFMRAAVALSALLMVLASPIVSYAQQPEVLAPQAEPAERGPGGEASLVLPDLSQVDVGGYDSRMLLMIGLVVCVFGLLFALVIMNQVKNLPVHKSMLEISDLIYETCKTYLIQQGKFIAILEIFIAVKSCSTPK